MSDDEQFHRCMEARLHFARAVVAYHQAGCNDDALLDDTVVTARRIAANAPIAVQQAKKSINMATQVDLKTGYAFEIEAYQKMVPTEDRLEGVRAFNEKRQPRFQGR